MATEKVTETTYIDALIAQNETAKKKIQAEIDQLAGPLLVMKETISSKISYLKAMKSDIENQVMPKEIEIVARKKPGPAKK